MKIFTKIVLLVMVSLCGLWAVQAEAAPIPGLYSTGVDNSNALVAVGTTDPHYTMTASPDSRFPGPAAVVIDPTSFPFNWVGNTPNSQWIGPHDETDLEAGGLYKYDITFNLTGLNPATAVITGEWAADNNAVILLDGNPTGITTPTLGFLSLQSFTISSGFAPGVNTLEFQVTNVPDPLEGGSPIGLQVELSGTASPVPEPVSLLFLGVGLVGLVGPRRKSKTDQGGMK